MKTLVMWALVVWILLVADLQCDVTAQPGGTNTSTPRPPPRPQPMYKLKLCHEVNEAEVREVLMFKIQCHVQKDQHEWLDGLIWANFSKALSLAMKPYKCKLRKQKRTHYDVTPVDVTYIQPSPMADGDKIIIFLIIKDFHMGLDRGTQTIMTSEMAKECIHENLKDIENVIRGEIIGLYDVANIPYSYKSFCQHGKLVVKQKTSATHINLIWLAVFLTLACFLGATCYLIGRYVQGRRQSGSYNVCEEPPQLVMMKLAQPQLAEPQSDLPEV